MRNRWFAGVIAGLAGALMLSAASSSVLWAQTQPPRNPCCVGSVDVVRVFNEYQRQKDLQDDLMQTQQALNSENEARRKRIDTLQAALQSLSPTDPTAKGRWGELLRMQIDYKNWADFSQAEVEREVGVWTARMYQEILDATGVIAETDGLQLIVYRDEFEPVANVQQVREQIRARRVVYAHPATDITQAVLDRLNSAYRAQPRTRMLGTTVLPQQPTGQVAPPAGGPAGAGQPAGGGKTP